MKEYINRNNYPIVKYSIVITIIIFIIIVIILSKIQVNEKSIIKLGIDYYYK